MLVVGTTWPVLLDHIEVRRVYIFVAGHGIVRIVHSLLTLALRFLVVVELKVGDQVMDRVDLLSIELNGHRVRHAAIQIKVRGFGRDFVPAGVLGESGTRGGAAFPRFFLPNHVAGTP